MSNSSSRHVLQDQHNQDLRPPEQDSKMAEGEAPRGQVEDCVGLLLGVHTVELDPKKSMSQFHLSMVDDLETFNRFPWGSVVYPTTLEQLQTRDLRAKYANYKE